MDDFSNTDFRQFSGTEPGPLIPAQHSLRIANYFIDIFLFSLLVLPVFLSYTPFRAMLFEGEEMKLTFFGNLVLLLLYGMYMGVIEALFRGRSPGKFVTGTRVVQVDSGEPIDTQAALLRGLCRAVPFESFSALSFPCVPWHDRWTRTRVVKIGRERAA